MAMSLAKLIGAQAYHDPVPGADIDRQQLISDSLSHNIYRTARLYGSGDRP
jgi:hypothetical protein